MLDELVAKESFRSVFVGDNMPVSISEPSESSVSSKRSVEKILRSRSVEEGCDSNGVLKAMTRR
jgi:hypothetical protein